MQRLRAERRRLDPRRLIAELDAALQRPESVARLARRWRLGVVDEFQDTDARQYAIFRRIFTRAGSALFLVGDPKQAIYRFRGGDIHAYAQAARDADKRWSLSGNWRADPALVEAINALFSRDGARASVPGRLHRLPSFALAAGAQARGFALDHGCPAGALACGQRGTRPGTGARRHDRAGDAGHGRGNRAAARARLRTGRRGAVPSRSLAPTPSRPRGHGAHAAGLAHSRGRAGARQRVRQSRGGGPRAPAARPARWGRARLRRCDGPAAVSACRSRNWPRRAAQAGAGRRLGVCARRCVNAGASVVPWRCCCACWPRWRRAGSARPKGRAAMPTCSRSASSWRRSAAAGAGMDAETGLAGGEAPRGPGRPSLRADERPRPLEGAGAVRLLTTHAAKGLQFDVVFAPFLWRSRGGQRPTGEPPVQYHDADGILRVDLGSPGLDDHRQVQEVEMRQEGLRQAYVALTRARHRCYTIWGRCRGMAQAPLAALVHPQLAPDGVLAATPDEAMLVDALARLVHAGGGSIQVAALPRPEGPAPLPLDAPPLLAARAPARTVLPARRTLSFQCAGRERGGRPCRPRRYRSGAPGRSAGGGRADPGVSARRAGRRVRPPGARADRFRAMARCRRARQPRPGLPSLPLRRGRTRSLRGTGSGRLSTPRCLPGLTLAGPRSGGERARTRIPFPTCGHGAPAGSRACAGNRATRAMLRRSRGCPRACTA